MADPQTLLRPQGAFYPFAGAMAQSEQGYAHRQQLPHGHPDSFLLCLRQMGAAEYRPDGFTKNIVHMANHVHNTGMGAAHQKHQTLPGFQHQTDLIPEIIRHNLAFPAHHKPLRDGFQRLEPRKSGNRIAAGKKLQKPLYLLMGDSVFLQKPGIKAGRQVREAILTLLILRIQKTGTSVQPWDIRAAAHKKPKATGVVIVPVAENHCVQFSQVYSQLLGVEQHPIAAAAVKQNVLPVTANVEGQPMFRLQVLPFCQPVVHKRCNLQHTKARLFSFSDHYTPWFSKMEVEARVIFFFTIDLFPNCGYTIFK